MPKDKINKLVEKFKEALKRLPKKEVELKMFFLFYEILSEKGIKIVYDFTLEGALTQLRNEDSKFKDVIVRLYTWKTAETILNDFLEFADEEEGE